MTRPSDRIVAEIRRRLMPADGCLESDQSYTVRCPNEECGDGANFLLNRRPTDAERHTSLTLAPYSVSRSS